MVGTACPLSLRPSPLTWGIGTVSRNEGTVDFYDSALFPVP